MKKQKGQTLVEFTLVLPIFLLLIFGLIYSGMLFYDYSTLSNIARSAARERAITVQKTDSTPSGLSNDDIKGFYFKEGKFTPSLVTSLYHATAFTIEGTDNIVVTITMQLGDRSPLMRIVLPEQYSIVYNMRKDYKD